MRHTQGQAQDMNSVREFMLECARDTGFAIARVTYAEVGLLIFCLFPSSQCHPMLQHQKVCSHSSRCPLQSLKLYERAPE